MTASCYAPTLDPLWTSACVRSARMQVDGADIAAAAGVAFTFVTKAGVGLSGMTGRGFVLRKVLVGGADCYSVSRCV